jgi:hypothetical protein
MALWNSNDGGSTPLVQFVLKTGIVSERKQAERILIAIAALCFLTMVWMFWPEGSLPEDVQENPNYEPVTR